VGEIATGRRRSSRSRPAADRPPRALEPPHHRRRRHADATRRNGGGAVPRRLPPSTASSLSALTRQLWRELPGGLLSDSRGPRADRLHRSGRTAETGRCDSGERSGCQALAAVPGLPAARIALQELLLVDEEIERAIIAHSSNDDIQHFSPRTGDGFHCVTTDCAKQRSASRASKKYSGWSYECRPPGHQQNGPSG